MMKKVDPNTVGFRLRTWRKSLGLSQQALAEQIGCKKLSIINYELNDRLPNGELLVKCAERGLNINWLLTGKGDEVERSVDIVFDEVYKGAEAFSLCVLKHCDKIVSPENIQRFTDNAARIFADDCAERLVTDAFRYYFLGRLAARFPEEDLLNG